MKLGPVVLTISLFCALNAAGDERKKDAPSTAEIQRLLTLVETKRAPNIYGAIHYPRWQEPLDGLKSVTAEAIAEHAHERMGDGVRLKVVGEPIAVDDVAGVLLKRSGGGIKDGTFPAYLYRDGRNGWGFLGFPIPYKAPRLLGRDGKFMAKALGDPNPYDGVLYEFDEATKVKYEAITRKLDAILGADGGAVQPATAPKSKSKDKKKSKPASEGRSQ